MYTTLKKIAIRYSVSPSYIKKQELIEGEHFIFVGKMKRYHIKKMDKLLVTHSSTVETKNSPMMDRFLLES